VTPAFGPGMGEDSSYIAVRSVPSKVEFLALLAAPIIYPLGSQPSLFCFAPELTQGLLTAFPGALKHVPTARFLSGSEDGLYAWEGVADTYGNAAMTMDSSHARCNSGKRASSITMGHAAAIGLLEM
jgi:hypothetical protein